MGVTYYDYSQKLIEIEQSFYDPNLSESERQWKAETLIRDGGRRFGHGSAIISLRVHRLKKLTPPELAAARKAAKSQSKSGVKTYTSATKTYMETDEEVEELNERQSGRFFDAGYVPFVPVPMIRETSISIPDEPAKVDIFAEALFDSFMATAHQWLAEYSMADVLWMQKIPGWWVHPESPAYYRTAALASLSKARDDNWDKMPVASPEFFRRSILERMGAAIAGETWWQKALLDRDKAAEVVRFTKHPTMETLLDVFENFMPWVVGPELGVEQPSWTVDVPWIPPHWIRAKNKKNPLEYTTMKPYLTAAIYLANIGSRKADARFTQWYLYNWASGRAGLYVKDEEVKGNQSQVDRLLVPMLEIVEPLSHSAFYARYRATMDKLGNPGHDALAMFQPTKLVKIPKPGKAEPWKDKPEPVMTPAANLMEELDEVQRWRASAEAIKESVEKIFYPHETAFANGEPRIDEEGTARRCAICGKTESWDDENQLWLKDQAGSYAHLRCTPLRFVPTQGAGVDANWQAFWEWFKKASND